MHFDSFDENGSENEKINILINFN